MQFSPQQGQAVSAVGTWLKTPGLEPFYLAGYAGTGKTTLAKHLSEQQKGKVLFAAYTGKAASVLNRKGCPASTIHSLIYKVVPPNQSRIAQLREKIKSSNGQSLTALRKELADLNKPKFILNYDSLISDCDLVIIDEVSMVGREIGLDLMSFQKKILVLGDPGQLPPVEGGGFFTGRTPDFVLTEIHRQAQDSPIINMATLVRQGGRLRVGAYGNSTVMSRTTAEVSHWIAADQVIVGLNRTRKELNERIRDSHNWIGSVPQASEKIICLRNNHPVGLLNGTQWRVEEAEDKGMYLGLKINSLDDPKPEPIEVDAHHFGLDFKNMPYWDRKQAEEFDFGYAITCHKSQGSQWPHVYIQNESYAFREDAAKWLYTALTRAEDTVTVAI